MTAALVLTALTIFVFEPVRHSEFVNFDDGEFIVENPHVASGLTLRNVAWAFRHPYDATGGTLTWISHMLDVQLFGLDSGRHHLTSLALHVTNSLLLLLALYRMTAAVWRSAFVAALFALHPLHVESVAWVSERKDVLSTTFLMITLLAYVAYVRRPGVRRYGLVAVFLTMGLMAKPMLATVPAVLALLDVWPLGRLNDRQVSAASIARLLREKVPLCVPAIAALGLAFVSQQASGAVSNFGAVSLGSRVQNAIVSAVTYLRKMVVPSDLVAFYPYRESLSVWTVLACLVILLVLTAAVWAIRHTHPYATVGWLWYLVTLTPVLGIVQVGSHAMADRFTYVPLIGIFVAVAWTGSNLLQRVSASAIGKLAALAIIVSCASQARQQVHVWRDSTSLWEHAIRVAPDNYRAHANLGVILANQGRLEDAVSEYTTALRLNPNQPKAENNLGLASAASGDKAGALAHYTAAIRLDPAYAHAHQNLGVLLIDLGRFDDAIVHGREAIRLNPEYAEAHMMLAFAIASRGQIDEAIPHALEALRLRPTEAPWHFTMAMMYLDVGDRTHAISQLETALRLNPSFTEASRALAELRK